MGVERKDENGCPKKERKMKKKRRKQNKDKKLKHMKVYYVNTRGIKSKLDSIQDIVAEEDPDIVGITETMLNENENIEIENYEVYRNDRNEEGGGVLIAVKDTYKNVTVEVQRENKEEESIWVAIGTNTVTRVGVVYAPQETRTQKVKLKEMYKRIEKEVQKARENEQQIIVMGDMNCKVGDMIDGNNNEVTKGGRVLKELIEREGVDIVNRSNKCKGKWTRCEGGTKSIIDYILMWKKDINNAYEMIIDEDRIMTPFKVVKNADSTTRTVYTDHNAMLCKIKWEGAENIEKKTRTIMTKSSYKKFEEKIQAQKISNLLEGEEPFQQKYTKWSKKVLEIKTECEIKVRTKTVTKQVRQLIKQKRKLKRLGKSENDETKRKILKTRRKLLDEFIVDAQKKNYAKEITATIENLRKDGGGVKEATFWEFKKRLERKKEEKPTAVMNKEGILKEKQQEILEVYKEFYTNLFKKEEARSIDEKNAEADIAEKFENIMREAKCQPPLAITEEEVEKEIKKLKRKKASDEEGWRNEMLQYGGYEMNKSIWHIIEELQKEGVPTEWEWMKIKSVYKGKGSRREVGNRRGLFLTSILCKLVERLLLRRIEKDLDISKYQTGGKKGMSTADNWIALMAVIDNNKRMKQNTYILLADAEKCFDKLWLEDCLVDMYESGVRAREVCLLHDMNKQAKIVIETPNGLTEPITVQRIVKQGTVFGPVMCCANSQRINNMKEKNITMITPSLHIEAMAYVDDIMGAGKREQIETLGRNLQEMEVKKKYTFNNLNGKSHYMVMKTGREPIEEVDITVRKGGITKTSAYNYLGNYLHESGTIERHLEETERKMRSMVAQARVVSSEKKLGSLSTSILLILYEKTIIPALTYNLEVWTNWRVCDWQKVEQIQSSALKMMLNMPQSTPYWGMMIELGIWPMKERIAYRKMMLYQNVICSSDNRLSRMIVVEQRRGGMENCWYEEITQEGQRYNIPVNRVDEYSKSEWKKLVKERIEEYYQMEAKQKICTMRKLRRLASEKIKCQEYIKKYTPKMVTEIMKTRLFMWDIGNNLGGNHICWGCEKEIDEMEHIMKCTKLKEEGMEQNVEWINKNDEESTILMMNYVKEYIERRELKRIMDNIDAE